IEKIKAGKAHELSEGDTLYLGACTKGPTAAKSLRSQPFSEEKAKQRAYSLKQSYMTYVLNTYVFGETENERIIKNVEKMESTGFEKYLIDKIRPYFGRTQKSLKEEFNIIGYPKNINEIIISKILGLEGRISSTAEFIKADIVPKTIRISEKNTIKESMSFPTFKFSEIIKETWETSEFKQYLEQKKFLFIIFKYKGDSLTLKDIVFWSIPEKDILEVQKVWEKTVDIIKSGVQTWRVGNKTYNNLPKAKDNYVAHVRPHARNSSDTYELPEGGGLTKQCFWLNNTYIMSQVEKYLNN
ncbi:MAG: Sau3AI family type II restriction endonuclease, partial [Tissierellia bacterium]|nr:Sau3AI family type II restriction endonuclease [Tissierellia bacterium]